jgi:uncharacterized protein YbjT (DUF2867 family)
MHVLLLGATGLIGSAIAARLRDDGARVTAVGRSGGTGADHLLRLDLRDATRPEHWVGALEDVDAVINAAGVLQDGARDSVQAVHVDAPAALVTACGRAGVRRFVHISALGTEDPRTAFSRTKQAFEAKLAASGLDWVILRPSVVVGRPAYGGSALFRGLAALPLAPRIEGAGRIQLVQLDEVAETAVQLAHDDAPHGLVLDLAASDPLTVEEVVSRYRRWLGWPPALAFRVPTALMRLMLLIGDLAGQLGWRPPVRSTMWRELARGATGDPSEWTRVTGIVPRSLDQALAAEPPSVQERWFARLYWLKPAILLVFGLFWIATGLVSLGPGRAAGEALLVAAGAGALSGPLAVAGSVADLAIGLGILVRRTARAALVAALALSLFYLLAATLLLPGLWADPLGPLVKIAPILLLNLVALAILEDR